MDFARSLFEFGTPAFWRLVDLSRKEAIEAAAREGVDMIFTFVYGGEVDDKFVDGVTKTVESYSGSVCFVRLRCDRAELLRRVGAKDRSELGKLTSKSGLDDMFARYDLDAKVPGARSLDIDTAALTPKEAAVEICARYRLPTL
ncbi:MAG: hypothetical protein JRM79_05165 [Nitrososphaerota archaeon]|nr:hypothetical protein [Nitrososphaerota archaeon]MDG6959016.1 hypothetical protein [Nitrososphaerota archaeon]MDG6960450.1 hypothetical protein [Nitrososphaerota archaeon]MDG6965999.1 hypothetical protein [Nitrososphaerota archaeon]MDG6972761.1 hypothetical protein [Nitrososphaerota archaeon]